MNENAIAAPHAHNPQLSEWLPIIAWAAVMFTFSTSGFTAAKTAQIITPVFHWLFPALSATSLAIINMLIRKAAHFTEYGILFWLLIRGPLRNRPYLAMAFCVVYAITDETHQLFVAGRTASIYDVALDSTGAMFSGFLRAAIGEII
jgi:VanZ family protein